MADLRRSLSIGIERRLSTPWISVRVCWRWPGGGLKSVESGAARVHFLKGDAPTIELPRKYDLIVSHFFLDCFVRRDLESLVARVSNAACPEARWLVSEFCLPGSGIRRLAADLLIQAMYWFFRIVTGLKADCLPDYSTLFARHGFQRVRHVPAAGGLLVSELWQRCPS